MILGDLDEQSPANRTGQHGISPRDGPHLPRPGRCSSGDGGAFTSMAGRESHCRVLLAGVDRHADRGRTSAAADATDELPQAPKDARNDPAQEAAKVQNDRAQRQAAAIQTWHDTPAKSGNEAFFQLGVDLRSAGISMADIEATLRQEAGYARLRLSVGERSRTSCGG